MKGDDAMRLVRPYFWILIFLFAVNSQRFANACGGSSELSLEAWQKNAKNEGYDLVISEDGKRYSIGGDDGAMMLLFLHAQERSAFAAGSRTSGFQDDPSDLCRSKDKTKKYNNLKIEIQPSTAQILSEVFHSQYDRSKNSSGESEYYDEIRVFLDGEFYPIGQRMKDIADQLGIDLEKPNSKIPTKVPLKAWCELGRFAKAPREVDNFAVAYCVKPIGSTASNVALSPDVSVCSPGESSWTSIGADIGKSESPLSASINALAAFEHMAVPPRMRGANCGASFSGSVPALPLDQAAAHSFGDALTPVTGDSK